MLSPTLDCSCTVKCTCDLIKSIQMKQEIEQVICFLKGLGEVYGIVKPNILMMDPLPSINKAYALVLQQEGQLQRNGTNDSKFFFTSSNQQNNLGNWRPQRRGGSSFGRGRGNGILGRGDGNAGRGREHNYTSKQCTYCNKFGHIVNQCYSKHGFPLGFKPRNNYAINNFVAPEGEQSQSEIDNSLQGSQGGTVTSSGVQFKPEQLQQLLTMLQQSSTKSTHLVSQISSGNVDESSSQQ